MVAETGLLVVGLMFAVLAIVGGLARTLNQSVIPFYITGGIVVGPSVAGRVELPYIAETEFIAIGAELGIVFLLFFLGLEFNLARLFANLGRIGKAGIVDLAINFGIGLGLGYGLFGAILPAILVAGVVYISSSAIITKSLIDLGWIANEEAEPILGILVFEDLFIAIYLAFVTAFVIGAGTLDRAAGPLGIAMGFLAGLLLLAYAGTALFERLLAVDSHEFTVLRTLGVTVLIAGAALAVGVSEAVAAFFIGMAVSSTSHVSELENLLEPIRDMFAAVFFFWIGLVTDPLLFGGVMGFILLGVLVMTPTKLVSGFAAGRFYGLSDRRSVRVALAMTTRGEFSLIIAAIALAGAGTGLSTEIAADINAFAVGYVLVMSILGTTLMRYSRPFEALVTGLRP